LILNTQYALETGKEAKASTELSRASMRITRWALLIAVISTISGVLIPVYLDRRASASNAAHDAAEATFRQQEINLFKSIDARLADETKVRADLANKPVPSVIHPR
jgi:hypothetical protein